MHNFCKNSYIDPDDIIHAEVVFKYLHYNSTELKFETKTFSYILLLKSYILLIVEDNLITDVFAGALD